MPAHLLGRIAGIEARFVRPVGPIGGGAAVLGGAASATGDTFSNLLDTTGLPGTSSLLGTATPSGAVDGEAVLAAGSEYLGIPYRWGGTNPATGLDCSGFVQRVFQDLGIELPRVSRDQARVGTEVSSLAEARPGDLIAFGQPTVNHIAIYAGDGKIMHAPRTGEVVSVTPIRRNDIASIRRVTDAPSSAGSPTATIGAGSGTRSGRLAPGAVASLGADVPYRDLFVAAGQRHGIDPALLAAVAKVESGFNPSAGSPAGARGLMQFMPATAAGMGIDPLDPAQAVDGAARYLSTQLNRFGNLTEALAAYNAGPGAVARAGGVPPYPETQSYVRKVTSQMERYAA